MPSYPSAVDGLEYGAEPGTVTATTNPLRRTVAQEVPVATKTAAYTLTAADDTVLASAGGGAFTLTLPTAVGIAGRTYTVVKTDSSANAVTLDGNGAETINGAATYALSTQYARVTVRSDGAGWIIVG
jgi:hypothetical protein